MSTINDPLNTSGIIEASAIIQQSTALGSFLYGLVQTGLVPFPGGNTISTWVGDIVLTNKALADTSSILNVAMLASATGFLFSGNPLLHSIIDLGKCTGVKRVYADGSTVGVNCSVYGSVTGHPFVNFEVATPVGFTGDMSACTTLQTLVIAAASLEIISSVGQVTWPIPGLNKSIKTWELRSYRTGSAWNSNAKFGTMSDLMSLVTFDMQNNDIPSAQINYILAQLLALKQAGGVLTTITLQNSTGSNGAPTGQGITDKASLISLGVSVTTA